MMLHGTRVGVSFLSMMTGLFLVLGGCGSGGSSSGGGGTPAATVQTGTVSGKVTSTAAGSPVVAGATVSTSAGSTTSAGNGTFTVPAPVGDRSVIHVEAVNFAEAFPVARVTAGQTTGLGVRLLPTGVSAPVTVASGGTVTVPNSTAQVTLPANGLVPKNGGAASGTVNVAVTPINPAVDPNLMPGDFTGVSAGGVTPIESFGALLVDIRDNSGTRYNLATGQTATIRIPLGTLSPNPPATIPLFYFDENTGLWQQEGTATLLGAGGNRYYEGTVTHFSFWNADRPLETVFISGCLRDSNNQAVANRIVSTNGTNYSGRAIAFTAADGTFRVAMRRSSEATLSMVEFNLQTYQITTVSNEVPVVSSTIDSTLPNCLVLAPAILRVSTEVLTGGSVGLTYNETLAATGGIPGYVWSLNPGSSLLPVGLSLNPAGVISGSTTTVGTVTITVRVTDSVGGTAIKQLSLTILPVGVTTLSISSLSPLPAGTVGVVYSMSLAASGGTPTLSWSVVSGALPVGVTLNPITGLLSGTPTTQGTSTFTVRVQDGGNPQQFDEQAFTLAINGGGVGTGGGTLTVTNASASVGGAFNGDIISQSIGGVSWGETISGNGSHAESFTLILYNQPGLTYQIVFVSIDPGVASSWTCVVPAIPGFTTCSGVTINQAGGTLTLANTVLSGVSGTIAPPITVNGTLTFTPF